MSDPALGPSSFIVLGFLAQRGPGTSYDLKQWADESVGYFWTFPRSQLYAEPQRLVSLGLLTEEQEAGGRRRRTFHITPAGEAALRQWLASSAGMPELRDLGLLKLFFLQAGDTAHLHRLAREQLALHQSRLAEYRALEEQLRNEPSAQVPLLTLKMGFLYAEANLTFWEGILKETGRQKF